MTCADCAPLREALVAAGDALGAANVLVRAANVNATVDRAMARDLAGEKRRIEDENVILRRTVDRLTKQVARLKGR